MMVIKDLSSTVDLRAGMTRHTMVVGLEQGGAVSVPIDALTYAQLVGAFEELYVQAQQEPYGTNRPYLEEQPAPTKDDVQKAVEEHIGHRLAPGPIPDDEREAAAQLRSLEAKARQEAETPEAVLRSVGFFSDEEEEGAVDVLGASGADDDEDDPGEDLLHDDDGVGQY